MRTICGIAILLLAATAIVWALSSGPRESRVVPKEIKARMAYHGVTEAYQDHDGNLYFLRDGRRCRL